jgi:Spy/CpxP family protein refolding chaperone
MRCKLLVGALAATTLLGGAAAMAQAPAAAAKPAAASSKQNLDEDIKLLRKDVRAEKSRVMLGALELDAEQTQKFLPIYKAYEDELGKLNDLRAANIREYASNYSKMTDNKADELVNQAFSYYKKRVDLVTKYYDKVRAALGTGTAARFVQVEALLLNLIDIQIQTNLPLVWAPSSP